jgi:hypothetical protein
LDIWFLSNNCNGLLIKENPLRGIKIIGAEGRTRTGTLLRAVDFESTASAIPPLRQFKLGTSACRMILPQEKANFKRIILGKRQTGKSIRPEIILSPDFLPWQGQGKASTSW